MKNAIALRRSIPASRMVSGLAISIPAVAALAHEVARNASLLLRVL